MYASTAFGWERSLLPIRDIRRGDVVVFKHPDTPEVDFIKRVAGLPGDSVAVRGGFLYVNGDLVEEPYVGKLYRDGAARPNGPVTVPEGEYFLMGDHRNRSADSREWGTVPAHLIKGRAFLVLLSTDAKPPPGTPPGQVTVRSLGRKLVNIVLHTRWDRSLTLIR